MEYDEGSSGDLVLLHQPFGLFSPTMMMFGLECRPFPDGKPIRNHLDGWLADNYDRISVGEQERSRRSTRRVSLFAMNIVGEGYPRHPSADIDWEVEGWKWVLLTRYQQVYDRLQRYIEYVGVVQVPAWWKRYLRRFFRKEFEARAEFEATVTRLALEAVVNRSLPVVVANEFLGQYGISPLR